MTYFYNWLMILCVSLLGSMIPGISFALVLRNTLHSSRSTGIWTAAGLGIGISIYSLLVIFGLAIFLHNSILSKIIHCGGAVYLAYVGIQCLFAKAKKIKSFDTEQRPTISPQKALQMGFLTNLLNPKVLLFFIALYTQFIRPDMPLIVTWIYGLTIVVVEFSWFSFVAILLTHPAVHKRFQSFSHWIERTSGAILLFISFKLVSSLF